MKSYSEFLAAGVPVKLTIGGRMLYVQRSEAGMVLDITFHTGTGTQSVSGVGKGFRAAPAGGFDTVTFQAGGDGTVEFIVTDGEVIAQFDDAETIIGNDDARAIPIRAKAGERIPVEIGGSTVEVTADNVGINNDNANAVPVKRQALATIVNVAPLVVNTGAAQAIASDATYKSLSIKNADDVAVIAIGGAGVTMANAAILLEPGDMWVEQDAAGAAWYAVSDIDGADMRVMGLKA